MCMAPRILKNRTNGIKDKHIHCSMSSIKGYESKKIVINRTESKEVLNVSTKEGFMLVHM